MSSTEASGLGPQELDAIEQRGGWETFTAGDGGPGLRHADDDFKALLGECRRLAAENIALTKALEEHETRYLCMNGHHLVSKNEITVCDAPVHEDGIRPFVTTGSIDGVKRCGAPVQRYRSDWEMEFEDKLEEARAENAELRAAYEFYADDSGWEEVPDPEIERLRAEHAALQRLFAEVSEEAERLTTVEAAFQEFVGAVGPWITAVLADQVPSHPLLVAVRAAREVLNRGH